MWLFFMIPMTETEQTDAPRPPLHCGGCSPRSEAASPRSGAKIVALRGPSSVIVTVEKRSFSRCRMNNEVKDLQFLVN